MFEGKPPHAHDSRNLAASAASGETPEDVLCELTWSDLVAKLAVARELRAEFARSSAETLASFDASSARHLALHHEPLREGQGERVVNPDDLGNRKAGCGMENAAVDRETSGIRGNT